MSSSEAFEVKLVMYEVYIETVYLRLKILSTSAEERQRFVIFLTYFRDTAQ